MARKSILLMFLVALAVVAAQFQFDAGAVQPLGVGQTLGFFDGH